MNINGVFMSTYTKNKNRTDLFINKDLFIDLKSLISDPKNPLSIIVPHVCNNIDMFGGGFAASVALHYPIVKENYHMLGRSFLKRNPGYCQFITALENQHLKTKLIFANMISQEGVLSKNNPRPINYLSLSKAMLQVGKLIRSDFSREDKVQIHAPKFGSGLAGGNWNFIRLLIEDIWQGLEVFIYEPQRK
jgi:hypothetical protein